MAETSDGHVSDASDSTPREQECVQLEHEIAQRRAGGGRARDMAWDVYQHDVEDNHGPPRYARASQNIAAARALLQGLLEPATPEDRKTQREIRELLDRAAQQQAESSLSRRRRLNISRCASTARNARDVSVHQPPRDEGAASLPQIQERAGTIRDARVVLDARRRERDNRRYEPDHGCHPRRGGRYDADEDRSPSPSPPGPQAFGRHILGAPFSQWFRTPTNVLKYSGESNPSLWLEDYRLAC